MGLCGRWRLTDSCVDYSRPWKALDWVEILEEYHDSNSPAKEYMHHLINRHEGEVAKAWARWSYVPFPLPRDAVFWDPQFAASKENFEALKVLRFERDPWGDLCVPLDVDLTKVGNTTILRTRDGDTGHWQLNGGGITLAELFYKFGEHYTVSELMNWYYNARKNLRKRKHAWGSADCRNASLQRWKTYGRPGHRSQEIDRSRPASKPVTVK